MGVLVEDPKPKSFSLAFDPAAKASVTASPTAVGELDGGTWLAWSVRIPRRAQEFDTRYEIKGFAEGPVAFDLVSVPAVDQAPRIAFFSCNGVQDPKDWTTQPAMEVLWERMFDRHRTGLCPDGSGGRYHVLLGGGDQIYCDSI